MFVVSVEFWADGNPWRTDAEVFTDIDKAAEFAARFSLWEFGGLTVGEVASIRSIRLDGDQDWIWSDL